MSTQLLAQNELDAIETIDSVGLEISDGGMIAAITKSEVEAQLDAAHKYGRSVKKFLNEALTLATLNEEIAASCMYSVPRAGKTITGPSVRLAEICISAYGNLHIGARVIAAEEKEVISQGVCWDLEKNVRITIEKRRKITDKHGKRFNDDMINVTGNAAASIALRDAAFRVIPRTYVNMVFEAARKVAVGDANTLAQRRAIVFDKLVKMGAMPDRILARLGKASIEDIGLPELEAMIGFGTAIHSGSEKVDDLFPPVGPDNAPTKGKVDLESLKPGKEGNRGHGNENLADATKKDETKADKAETAAPSTETKAAAVDTKQPIPDTTDPESKCTESMFLHLERIQNENDIAPKVFIAFVKETLGYKMVSQLKKKDFGRAETFLKNGGKE